MPCPGDRGVGRSVTSLKRVLIAQVPASIPSAASRMPAAETACKARQTKTSFDLSQRSCAKEMPNCSVSRRPVMSSGANWGRTVTQTAMRWWQAWRRQAGNDLPLEDVSIVGLPMRSYPVPKWSRRGIRCIATCCASCGTSALTLGRSRRGSGVHCATPSRSAPIAWLVGRCQHWFHGRLSDDAPRSFCPNAELYEEIAASQQQAV
jgi:hypothetical protein